MYKFAGKHNSRVLAFQLFYIYFITGKLPSFSHVDIICESCSISEYDHEYLEKLVDGFTSNITKIRTELEKNAPKRTFDQINTLEKSMLSASILEFQILNLVDPKISIDEYVSIAKKYGGDFKFVNGVLDSVMNKSIANGKVI